MELLIVMLLMETLYGIPGVIAGPIFYAYLKRELSTAGPVDSGRGWLRASAASLARKATPKAQSDKYFAANTRPSSFELKFMLK
ncbi:hypothetical protein ACTMU2_06365 [Cupriavidus basilensis]